MPASRIRRLARTRRWLIAPGAVRKAVAIASALSPSTVCNINGPRIAASIAGWAQANIRRRRQSGTSSGSIPAVASSTDSSSRSAAASRVRRRRTMSIIRRRAAASSQASDVCGTPRVGQLARTGANASDSASSAAATSPVRAAR